MFFQPPPPEKEPTNIVKSTASLKSARRKSKKRAQKFKNKKQALKKEKQRFANTMSSWAENFTMAATWQLKHQVAHWKSKARALEYENNILRLMLRQYYVKGNVSEINQIKTMSMETESDTEKDVEEEGEVEDEVEGEVEDEEEQNEETIEISEEFIDFLKGNVEFRKMRLERERLRQLEEEMPMKLLEACPDGPTDHKAEFQRLYGEHWERILALEMSMQSQFMSDCDKEKPSFWPAIPLRMSF